MLYPQDGMHGEDHVGGDESQTGNGGDHEAGRHDSLGLLRGRRIVGLGWQDTRADLWRAAGAAGLRRREHGPGFGRRGGADHAAPRLPWLVAGISCMPSWVQVVIAFALA